MELMRKASIATLSNSGVQSEQLLFPEDEHSAWPTRSDASTPTGIRLRAVGVVAVTPRADPPQRLPQLAPPLSFQTKRAMSPIGPFLPRRPRASVSVIGSLAAARLNARGGS